MGVPNPAWRTAIKRFIVALRIAMMVVDAINDDVAVVGEGHSSNGADAFIGTVRWLRSNKED